MRANIASDAGSAIARLNATLARSGSVAAAVLLALTLAWIVTLLIAPAPADGADAAAQLRFWDDHEGWLVASFVSTAPLSLVHAPVWPALERGVLLSGVVFLPALALTAALLGRDTGDHTASIIHA